MFFKIIPVELFSLSILLLSILKIISVDFLSIISFHRNLQVIQATIKTSLISPILFIFSLYFIFPKNYSMFIQLFNIQYKFIINIRIIKILLYNFNHYNVYI